MTGMAALLIAVPMLSSRLKVRGKDPEHHPSDLSPLVLICTQLHDSLVLIVASVSSAAGKAVTAFVGELWQFYLAQVKNIPWNFCRMRKSFFVCLPFSPLDDFPMKKRKFGRPKVVVLLFAQNRLPVLLFRRWPSSGWPSSPCCDPWPPPTSIPQR